MKRMQHMQGWVINDANLFIQSFKQLTYIQDRKKNLQNRTDSFYYFQLLNQFQNEIGIQRSTLFDSYTDLKKLFDQYSQLPIWKRVIQRTNDIIQVSKMVFPVEITDEFFVEKEGIEGVINFLGKMEEDGEIQPMQVMRLYGSEGKRKSVYQKKREEIEREEIELQKQRGNSHHDSNSHGFFKQSHIKYLQSVKNMCRLYQPSLDSDLDIPQTQQVYTFNHHKPLSVNLQLIYSQMLSRNSHIQQSILQYLKSTQFIANIRKTDIQKDMMSLKELQARVLSQSVSVKNFQSEKFMLESPIGKEMRRFSNFVGLIDVPAFQKKKGGQRVSINLEGGIKWRKSRKSQLLVHAMTQIERHKSMKVRKMRESTSMMKTAEFDMRNDLSVSNSQFNMKQERMNVSANMQTSIQSIIDSKGKTKGKLRRLVHTNSALSENISPCSSLNHGIVVQKAKNFHLLNPVTTIPSYKEYIRKHGISILRASACF